jgi:hypothetical protein
LIASSLASIVLLAAVKATAAETSAQAERDANKHGTARATAPALPPVPDGVTHLDFDAFFQRPVGPQGLEITAAVAALDGKRVRLLGYMVKQANPSPWKILLSPIPVVTREREYNQAEDLPPNVVHVFLPRDPSPIRPHTPGLFLLTGRFEVGNRAEADGRVSMFRLFLDPPRAAAPAGKSESATAVGQPAAVAGGR